MAKSRILDKDDPENLRFHTVAACLARNPELTKRHFALMHSVPYDLLNYWEGKGWLTFGKNKKHPWRRKFVDHD